MSKSLYIGNFPEAQPASPEHLSIVFSAGMVSHVHRWKNKNRSADFLADYFANFFPGADEAPTQTATQTATQTEMRSAIGYIANELLENAIKFNHDQGCHMGIQLHLYDNSLVFVATNSIDPARAADFQAYISKLLEGNPQELYLEKLEANATEEGDGSGLGLLTMLSDYGADLGWRFTDATGANGQAQVILETRVELPF